MQAKPLAKKQQRYISDLTSRIFCRIRPSKIHGVGVFAIRPIPKGTDIFSSGLSAGNSTQWISIPSDVIFGNPHIPEGVKSMIHDFMTIHDGHVDFPSFSLNQLNISFYLNHSDTPNVKTEDGDIFTTTRDIKEGEELFSNYRTYSDGQSPTLSTGK